MNPVTEVKKAFPTGRVILTTLLCFILINAAIDALGTFVPGVGAAIANFISRPFSFVKNKIKPPAAG